MRQLIRELSAEATVILSTHIMQEVEALCDRVLILHRGELAVDARLEALQKQSSASAYLHAGIPWRKENCKHSRYREVAGSMATLVLNLAISITASG